MRRWILLGLILAAVVAGAVIAVRGPAVAVETTPVRSMTVREYVAEDAKTRLDDEYIVDMPVSGTLERIVLEVGDDVERGQIIARIDPYDLRQQILQVKALMAQQYAQVTGVDVAKPKREDIASALARVQEMRDTTQIAERARSVAQVNFDEAELNYTRAKALLEAGAASQAYLDEMEMRYKAGEQELERTKLEVERVEKALDQARLAYDRVVGSVDDNEYQRDAIHAEVERLEAELALLTSDLAKTEIRSPVSGPVLEKYVEDRRVLREGSPLLKLGDMGSIEIESDILSEEIAAVEVGDKVVVRGKALRGRLLEGDSVEGIVTRVYPAGFEKISSLGVEQQRVKTIIGFDNSEAGLRPGTSIDVEVITEEAANVLAVPDRAVFRHEGAWAVFVVTEAHRARIQTVEVGLSNEDWAEIRSGLEEGMTIVTELNNNLEDGTRLTLLP